MCTNYLHDSIVPAQGKEPGDDRVQIVTVVQRGTCTPGQGTIWQCYRLSSVQSTRPGSTRSSLDSSRIPQTRQGPAPYHFPESLGNLYPVVSPSPEDAVRHNVISQFNSGTRQRSSPSSAGRSPLPPCQGSRLEKIQGKNPPFSCSTTTNAMPSLREAVL